MIGREKLGEIIYCRGGMWRRIWIFSGGMWRRIWSKTTGLISLKGGMGRRTWNMLIFFFKKGILYTAEQWGGSFLISR